MTQQEQMPHRTRPRPNYRTVQVRRVTLITPHMVRVTVAGDALAGFAPQGPAEHIRLFFPAPGQDTVALPVWGPDGPEYPPGRERPVSRVYTPRRWDAAAQELDIDLLVHGDGPGSQWASDVRAGDAVVLTGPGGPYRLAPDADWYLLAADDAGLPAAATILEALPATARALVFLEVADAADEQPLVTPATAQVTWLHRGADGGVAGRALDAALREAQLPAGNGRVWVGCEASIMRDIRRRLLNDRGMDRTTIHTHGYWRSGVANHPDHDLGDD